MTPLLSTESLVERLLPIERDYFLWLNHQRSDFLDTFMYVYSDKHTWIPVALVLLGVLVYKVGWKRSLLFIGCGIIIGLLCDMVAAEFIKPFFARLRPTHHPDFKDLVEIVNNKRGGRFGFISNHAANGFGIAIFSSLLFRYKYYTITIYTWVLITVYSRIYLGVHFITDVIGGFIWGTASGLLVCFICLFILKEVFRLPQDELSAPLLSRRKAHLVMGALALTVVYIIIRAAFFSL